MTKEELMCKCTELEYRCKQIDAENAELRKKVDVITRPTKCNTYQMAVDSFSKSSRLVLAMEEMSELTKELSKHYKGENNTAHISEEMADVEIMLEQLKIIFQNRAEIDCVKAEKLYRLSERIFENDDTATRRSQ